MGRLGAPLPSWLRKQEKQHKEKYCQPGEAALGSITGCYAAPRAPGFRVEYDVATNTRKMQMMEPDGSWVDLVPKSKTEGRLGRWLQEAAYHAEQADMFVRIEVENSGVSVVGKSGDNYEARSASWLEMEEAETNPLLPLVKEVERELAAKDVLERVERMAAHG